MDRFSLFFCLFKKEKEPKNVFTEKTAYNNYPS